MPDEEKIEPSEDVETEAPEEESADDEVSEEFFPENEPSEDEEEAKEEFDIQDPGEPEEDPEDDEEEVPEQDDDEILEDDDDPAGEADPEPAGEQVGISPELSERAAGVGVTEEDLDLFASPEALEQYVARREQQDDVEAAPAVVEKQQEYTVTLDPELYDEEIISEFSSLAKHLTGEMEQVRAAHAQVLSHLDDEQQRAFVSRMDARFASMPDELRSVFGTGSFDELDPNGPEMKARAEVVDMFNTLADKYPSQSEDVAWNRSLSALHGEAMTKTERSKIRSSIRSQRAVANRPTQRESSGNLTPQESAVAAVAEKMSDF